MAPYLLPVQLLPIPLQFQLLLHLPQLRLQLLHLGFHLLHLLLHLLPLCKAQGNRHHQQGCDPLGFCFEGVGGILLKYGAKPLQRFRVAKRVAELQQKP